MIQWTRPDSHWFGYAFLGAFLVLAWLAPSVRYHADGLDEALLVEGSSPPLLVKHPAAELSVWAVLRLARSSGITLSSLRVIQLWNAWWMYVGLCAIYFLLLRNTRNGLLSLGVVFSLGCTHVSLHLMTDPFLMYWPPGLAMFAVAMAIASREGTRARGDKLPAGDRIGRTWFHARTGGGGSATACMALAALFNPMTLLGCPLIARTIALRQRAGTRRRASLLTLIVGLVLAAGLYAFQHHARGGPFGHWSSRTPGTSYRAAREAFLAHAPRPSDSGPIPRESAGTELLLALCIGGAIASGLVLLWSALSSKVAATSKIVVLGTCALSTLFVAWWNPGQPMFWILPWWFLASGAGLVLHGADRRSVNLLGGSGFVLALSLAVLNGWRYVAPSTVPDGRIAAAHRIGALLSRKDLLVMQEWPDNYVRYFGGIPSTGLLSMGMHLRPHESGMDVLRGSVDRVHRNGGHAYMEIPPPGEGYLSKELRSKGLVGFREGELATLRWGAPLDLGGSAFLEIIEVP